MAKHKYNINQQISLLPKWQTTEWCAEQLQKEGIPQRTFFRDKAILVGDENDISGHRLLIYAKFFGVTVDQLFNYSAHVVSVYARDGARSAVSSEKKIIKRTGLTK